MSDPRANGDALARAPQAGGGAGVEARGWGWRHAGRLAWALDGVDLRIEPGERVLVLGPSGSGKSTLMAGLAGLLGGEDEGEAKGSLVVDGAAPADLRGRIGLVMQDPEAQVVLARVGDDVAFGMENLGVPREEIWPRVSAATGAVGLDAAADHPTTALSGGQKQRLALASVLAMGPCLLLLDEPTANLDPVGVAGVRGAVERVLDESEATLVVIEHRVDIWADLVDRVVVVLDGAIAADGPINEVLACQARVLRDRGIWLPGDDVAAEAGALPPLPAADSSAPVLSARGLAIGYDPGAPVREDIDLDIARGASTCVVGPNGVGKSTLALTLAGLLPALSGTISATSSHGAPDRKGDDPHEWSSRDMLGRISMVFQEPEYQFVARTVRGELEVGPRAAGASGPELDALVDEHLDALGLSSLAGANPMTLSGGEKRRLSVATALISAPDLLILDEPTFGQDRRTWLGLVRLLRGARERGTTLVSITHDPAFVAAMGDAVIDLSEVGRPPAQNPEGSARDAGPARSGGAGEGEHGPAGTGADEAGDADEAGGAGSSGAQAAATAAGGAVRADHPRARARRTPGREGGRARRGLDRFNPVTRILALIVMTTPLLISVDPVSASVALGLELLVLPAARMRARNLALRCSPLAVAAPLSALSMLLYASPGGATYWSMGPAAITDRSIWLAIGIALRVCAVALPAIVLLSNIDPTDMGDGLAQILHLPARPILAALAGARMTGLMAADWKALERARRIRGIGDGSRVRSFLRGSFSLLVFALRRSAKLSLTMEARGFGAPGPRTWARPSQMGAADAALMAVAVLIPAAAITVAVLTSNLSLVGR
ncbi:ATP-binding cassette domain-containing protein [Schaalia georgiae]|nr:ATP-binding cassette domain-containing protein [Schaalia georgiae]